MSYTPGLNSVFVSLFVVVGSVNDIPVPTAALSLSVFSGTSAAVLPAPNLNPPLNVGPDVSDFTTPRPADFVLSTSGFCPKVKPPTTVVVAALPAVPVSSTPNLKPPTDGAVLVSVLLVTALESLELVALGAPVNLNPPEGAADSAVDCSPVVAAPTPNLNPPDIAAGTSLVALSLFVLCVPNLNGTLDGVSVLLLSILFKVKPPVDGVVVGAPNLKPPLGGAVVALDPGVIENGLGLPLSVVVVDVNLNPPVLVNPEIQHLNKIFNRIYSANFRPKHQILLPLNHFKILCATDLLNTPQL